MATTAHFRSQKHKHDAQNIKEALTETAGLAYKQAGNLFEKTADGLKHQSEEIRDSMISYTRKKPFAALGIACLIGATIALLLRR